MNNTLLVINAGSSSIKFAVYQQQAGQLVAGVNGQIEGIGTLPHFSAKQSQDEVLLKPRFAVGEIHSHKDAITLILNWLRDYLGDSEILAVGHRIVHGGQHYSAPVLIAASVLAELETLVPLAPLHQPHNLIAIRILLEILPTVPQVACFDTAFHRTQSAIAQRIALPQRFADAGIRRYGFHGLSYEYIASMLPTLDPCLENARVIVAHLGNGASLCALKNGCSIATTMGFSPLDGLVMGTRCGSIDPGVLLYLMDHHSMDARELEQLLYYESGLLGVSGISSDMRVLIASNDLRAEEAIDLFVYRIGREIGSLVAALGGLDALVFTGGIGEHAADIRAKVCQHSAWLGLELDEAANQAVIKRISTPVSKVSAWVVATDENWMIAHHTFSLFSSV